MLPVAFEVCGRWSFLKRMVRAEYRVPLQCETHLPVLDECFSTLRVSLDLRLLLIGYVMKSREACASNLLVFILPPPTYRCCS